MPDYKVYYDEPSYTIITAENAEAAREAFMNGEWDETHQDLDGTVGEPNYIMEVEEEA